MRFILCFCILLGLFACEKEIPMNELESKAWFKQLQTPCNADAICVTIVCKAVYNNKTVYYSQIGGASCDPYFSLNLYDVNGEVVKSYIGPTDYVTFSKEVTGKEILWRCDQN